MVSFILFAPFHNFAVWQKIKHSPSYTWWGYKSSEISLFSEGCKSYLPLQTTIFHEIVIFMERMYVFSSLKGIYCRLVSPLPHTERESRFIQVSSSVSLTNSQSHAPISRTVEANISLLCTFFSLHDRRNEINCSTKRNYFLALIFIATSSRYFGFYMRIGNEKCYLENWVKVIDGFLASFRKYYRLPS